jgi:hypothetical protein
MNSYPQKGNLREICSRGKANTVENHPGNEENRPLTKEDGDFLKCNCALPTACGVVKLTTRSCKYVTIKKKKICT